MFIFLKDVLDYPKGTVFHRLDKNLYGPPSSEEKVNIFFTKESLQKTKRQVRRKKKNWFWNGGVVRWWRLESGMRKGVYECEREGEGNP